MAVGLIRKSLDREQLMAFDKSLSVVVKGKSRTSYRIVMGTYVQVLSFGTPTGFLCLHGEAYDSLQEENFLMQLLMIKYDEKRFLQVAKRH